jgi:hypothetical protein
VVHGPVRTMIAKTLYPAAIPTLFDPSVVVFVRILVGEVLNNSISKHSINKEHLRKQISP